MFMTRKLINTIRVILAWFKSQFWQAESRVYCVGDGVIGCLTLSITVSQKGSFT